LLELCYLVGSLHDTIFLTSHVINNYAAEKLCNVYFNLENRSVNLGEPIISVCPFASYLLKHVHYGIVFRRNGVSYTRRGQHQQLMLANVNGTTMRKDTQV